MISPRPSDSLTQKGLKLSHLRLLAALADTGQISQAAALLSITQPAASRLLSEVERIVGAPVHCRTGRGMTLTPIGQALALRAQRVQTELRDAARDIAEVTAGEIGHVRIGSVTGPAIDRVLPVLRAAGIAAPLIDSAATTHAPRITAEITVAPSDQLCEQLLAGKLDFAIGRLPEGPSRALLQITPIASEPVSLLARRNHPLANRKPTPAELMAYDWVMPPTGSLLTRTIRARLRAHGLPEPTQRLSTDSFLLIVAQVQHSNAIAPLARAVATAFTASADAAFTLLDTDLGIEVEPFGLITRQGAILPPVAARLAMQIQSQPTESR